MNPNDKSHPEEVLAEMADLAQPKDHEEDQKKKKKKKDKKKISRGVETMFRTTAGMNIRLSEIADQKAHFLLYINSILISVVGTMVLRDLGSHPEYIIPSVIFLATSLVTFVLSVLVTMPLITHGKFRKEDVENKTANLLFFGNYHNMDMQQYEWAMSSMIKDPDFVYGSMIRDSFHLGLVLDKKFKRLRVAFWIFMFGFVVSVISFLVVDYMI